MDLTRCSKSPFRFLFLFLGFIWILYTIYGMSLDCALKEYLIHYFCKPVILDNQTSIVLIGYMTFMMGNWIQAAGFALGCIGAYCFLLEPEGRNKRKASGAFSTQEPALFLLWQGLAYGCTKHPY